MLVYFSHSESAGRTDLPGVQIFPYDLWEFSLQKKPQNKTKKPPLILSVNGNCL